MPQNRLSAYYTPFLYADKTTLGAEKEKNSMQIKCDKCSAVSDTALRKDIAEYARMRERFLQSCSV